MLEGKTIKTLEKDESYGTFTLTTADGDRLVISAASNDLGGWPLLHLNGEPLLAEEKYHGSDPFLIQEPAGA